MRLSRNMQAVVVLLANCPRRHGWVPESVIDIYKLHDTTLRALERRGMIENTIGLSRKGEVVWLWRLTPIARAVAKAVRP